MGDGQIIIRAVKLLPVVPFLPALALIGVVPVPTRAESTDRVTRTLTFSAAKPIRVEATIADLSIVGSNRPDTVVEVVRRAPGPADLARYPVVIDAAGDGVRIAVVQQNGGRDANLKSDIAIRVPSNAPFEAVRVFEGRVRLTGLRQSCDVDLRRGAIEATGLAGRVRLESGIGSVDVRDSELTPGGMMRLRVFNGPLRVRFPSPPANARILAVTLNGTLTSAIPLTMKDRFGPRFGETTIGTGDPVMSLDVVKGDIEIRVDRQ
jgi:hypothetical protein